MWIGEEKRKDNPNWRTLIWGFFFSEEEMKMNPREGCQSLTAAGSTWCFIFAKWIIIYILTETIKCVG
jgi:hypothetical protein